MRYHNLMVIGLMLSTLGATIAFGANATIIAIACSVVALVLFVTTVISQKALNKASSAAIKRQYDAFVSALNRAQESFGRDLQGADEATVKAVADKLIEAGRHMGSNPSWSNTRRIITTSDVVQWYANGQAAADAALALIDEYKKSRQA